jgi:hypothetical protein
MHRLRTRIAVWALALLPALSGCIDATGEPQSPGVSPPAASDPREFADRLLAIAKKYEGYGRIGTEARWAPMLCRTPPPGPGISRSDDVATHGRKMYWLFVKEKPESFSRTDSYTVEGKPNPVGQVVVKEAWEPEEVKDAGRRKEHVFLVAEVGGVGKRRYVDNSFFPYTGENGKVYHAKAKSGLFIMFKVEPDTAGTDEGWVYGTVTPYDKKVTSVGRVESCMGCHRQAPHDRLFGLSAKDPRAPDRTGLRPATPPSP